MAQKSSLLTWFRTGRLVPWLCRLCLSLVFTTIATTEKCRRECACYLGLYQVWLPNNLSRRKQAPDRLPSQLWHLQLEYVDAGGERERERGGEHNLVFRPLAADGEGVACVPD